MNMWILYLQQYEQYYWNINKVTDEKLSTTIWLHIAKIKNWGNN